MSMEPRNTVAAEMVEVSPSNVRVAAALLDKLILEVAFPKSLLAEMLFRESEGATASNGAGWLIGRQLSGCAVDGQA